MSFGEMAWRQASSFTNCSTQRRCCCGTCALTPTVVSHTHPLGLTRRVPGTFRRQHGLLLTDGSPASIYPTRFRQVSPTEGCKLTVEDNASGPLLSVYADLSPVIPRLPADLTTIHRQIDTYMHSWGKRNKLASQTNQKATAENTKRAPAAYSNSAGSL